MDFNDDFIESLSVSDFRIIEPQLIKIERHLTLRTFISGYTLSETDRKVWVALRRNKITNSFIKKGSLTNIPRWFKYIQETHPEIEPANVDSDYEANTKKPATTRAGAGYAMALPDTEKGVVTRFPPEPSYVYYDLN